ncbi:MAG: iron ABC transporter permease [Desulfuromonadaceae bacterium]|nr:iron ABC transporter permease [Desulfuromonadaceae bacterium]
MQRKIRRTYLWLPLCLLFFVIAVVAGLKYGSVALSTSELVEILLHPQDAGLKSTVVWQLRLPRVALAALVGMALAVSGTVFQAVLRNPLADPYLLGVSGGAALGAVLALTFFSIQSYAVPVFAFSGALLALFLVYLVARAHQAATHTLILAGVMVGSLCTAVLMFLLLYSPSDPMRSALFWLAGNLSRTEAGWLPYATAACVGVVLLLWGRASLLDVFTQGEDVAADLGVDIGRERLLLLAGGGLLVAIAVALAGLVGFVGLVVPHAARLLWGAGHARLIPAAAIAGAGFLVAADALARTLLAPAEVPIGVITALVGAPFFLYLLRLRGR